MSQAIYTHSMAISYTPYIYIRIYDIAVMYMMYVYD